MKINEHLVPAHYHPQFVAVDRNGVGYITSITDHDLGNGFCLVGVPIIFTRVCFGSLHRHAKAFCPSEWLGALDLCRVLNDQLLEGKRDMTDASVKSSFGYFCGINREINAALREEARQVAILRVKETQVVHRVWSVLVPQGIEYHVCQENEKLGVYPFHRAEIQHTMGPKSFA